jgi:hypothetical protein
MCVLAVMKEMTNDYENFNSVRRQLATTMIYFVDINMLQHRRDEMKATAEMLLLKNCLGATRVEDLINDFSNEADFIENNFDEITSENIDSELLFRLLIRTLRATVNLFNEVLDTFNNSQQTNQ